jgi:hypothetical protein
MTTENNIRVKIGRRIEAPLLALIPLQLVTHPSLFRTTSRISCPPKLTFSYNRGLIIDGHEWSMAQAQSLTS